MNGVFGERAFELLVFIAGVFTLLIYCILNFTQTTKSTDQTSWIIKLVSRSYSLLAGLKEGEVESGELEKVRGIVGRCDK